MITMITGLPGHGKTLYAINLIKAYSEKEKREVFYSGINGLMLPWTEIKAEEWMTCPPGSIIVIDEAQFKFPKKPNGSKLPDFYEQLAVHRHSGYDIFLITQDPGLVDAFVRKLVGRHFHVIRKFGMQRANVWEFQAVNVDCQKPSSHKHAILHKFGYPKEVYGYYKSAEVHTVKRSIPMKLILAVLFIICVIAAGYYALHRFQGKGQRIREEAGLAPSPGAEAFSAVRGVTFDPVADAKRYVFNETPRVAGLPQTAPKYDELTKPTTVPVPAACVYSRSTKRCSCYTQQATPMQVEYNMCLDISHNGYFEQFNRDARRLESGTNAQNLKNVDHLPMSGASTADVGSRLVVLPNLASNVGVSGGGVAK